MMKIFTAIFALVIGVPALASFDGYFSGTGSAVFHSSGGERRCDSIALRFLRGPNKVRLLEGGYSCEDVQASFDPFTLDIRGEKIYSEGAEVGTISESRLELFYVNAEENFTYHWLLELSERGLSYLEEWTDAGRPALTVRGQLRAGQ